MIGDLDSDDQRSLPERQWPGPPYPEVGTGEIESDPFSIVWDPSAGIVEGLVPLEGTGTIHEHFGGPMQRTDVIGGMEVWEPLEGPTVREQVDEAFEQGVKCGKGLSEMNAVAEMYKADLDDKIRRKELRNEFALLVLIAVMLGLVVLSLAHL